MCYIFPSTARKLINIFFIEKRITNKENSTKLIKKRSLSHIKKRQQKISVPLKCRPDH